MSRTSLNTLRYRRSVHTFKLTGSPSRVGFSIAASFRLFRSLLLFCCNPVPSGPCLWPTLESGICLVLSGTSRWSSLGASEDDVSALRETGSPSPVGLSWAICSRLFFCLPVLVGLSYSMRTGYHWFGTHLTTWSGCMSVRKLENRRPTLGAIGT